MLDPYLVHPDRRIVALDSGVGRDLSRNSGELGCEIKSCLDFRLSNIAQQNLKTRVNMRVRRANPTFQST